MKYLSFAVFFVLISCGNNKEVLLPKSDITIIKAVDNHSPIYIFFKFDGKDTVAEVNRKNSIISTNWIFNIDKRLPLRLVIPEVMKLQEKKRSEKMHKNEEAQNYFSYADSIGKNMAFVPFTQVHYKMLNPKFVTLVYFDKNNQIWVNGMLIKKEKLKQQLHKLKIVKSKSCYLAFSKDLNFGDYIQSKVFIMSSNIKIANTEEYIY